MTVGQLIQTLSKEAPENVVMAVTGALIVLAPDRQSTIPISTNVFQSNTETGPEPLQLGSGTSMLP